MFVADANETTLTTPDSRGRSPHDPASRLPEAFDARPARPGRVYTYIVNSGLPKALIDLVFLRASQINGCAYCIDMHSRDLLKGGIAVEKMMLVSAWREAGDIFTDKEKAALQWAEAVTLISETHAPDEAFAAVSAQFQPKEISDLTLAIGVINAYNRLSIGFRRPPGGEPAA